MCNGAAASRVVPERSADRIDSVHEVVLLGPDLPYRKEYSAIRYPAELNRRPGWLAGVGPYVSVICGHPDFIENSIFPRPFHRARVRHDRRNVF
ncbi:MAG: hypothetical protein ABSB01_17410 [Streptosporangiaceae bacterium]|jgi:hypothetical protein